MRSTIASKNVRWYHSIWPTLQTKYYATGLLIIVLTKQTKCANDVIWSSVVGFIVLHSTACIAEIQPKICRKKKHWLQICRELRLAEYELKNAIGRLHNCKKFV